MSRFTRRSFLKLSGGGLAIGASAVTPGQVLAKPGGEDIGRATLPYPGRVITQAASLPVNRPLSFNYPDESSPCALIRMGRATPGGVGPEHDIVAYSTLCTHMGCPVLYDPDTRDFKCPCHFSVFDSEKTGQMVTGQATENLPSIILSYDSQDDSISAIGVDGLIYGRQSNIL